MSSSTYGSVYPLPKVRPVYASEHVIRRAHDLIMRMTPQTLCDYSAEIETTSHDLDLISDETGVKYSIDTGFGETATGSVKDICDFLKTCDIAGIQESKKLADAEHWQSFLHVGHRIRITADDKLTDNWTSVLPHVRVTAHLYTNSSDEQCVADFVHIPCENKPPKTLLLKPGIRDCDRTPFGENARYTEAPSDPDYLVLANSPMMHVFQHAFTGKEFFVFFTTTEKGDIVPILRLLEDLPEDLYITRSNTIIPTVGEEIGQVIPRSLK